MTLLLCFELFIFRGEGFEVFLAITFAVRITFANVAHYTCYIIVTTCLC